MQKHEMKARVESQIDEWKGNLAVMKAKADAATGDAKVTYAEQVSGLQKQFDELKIKSASAWDSADDAWDNASDDLEKAWDDWTDRAGKAWDELKG